eukprot:scaffold96_cov302-Prasinococcus_capsulatus_cf.AAC.5
MRTRAQLLQAAHDALQRRQRRLARELHAARQATQQSHAQAALQLQEIDRCAPAPRKREPSSAPRWAAAVWASAAPLTAAALDQLTHHHVCALAARVVLQAPRAAPADAPRSPARGARLAAGGAHGGRRRG